MPKVTSWVEVELGELGFDLHLSQGEGTLSVYLFNPNSGRSSLVTGLDLLKLEHGLDRVLSVVRAHLACLNGGES